LLPRLTIVAIIITVIVLIALYPEKLIESLESYCDWMVDNIWLGSFLIFLVCIPGTTLGAPGTMMTFPTGYIMHEVFDEKHWKSIPIGVLTVYLGTYVGSIFTFLIGRYVFKSLAERMSNKYKIIGALDHAFLTNGFKTCALFRMCPLIPVNIFNFVIGGTSIHFWAYCAAYVAYIPTTTLNVFIGTTLNSL
jgi:uncharacterized membrane protein YdjX (TVP38/TMEM64 family)